MSSIEVGQKVNIRGIGTVQVMKIDGSTLSVNFNGEGWPTVQVDVREVDSDQREDLASAREYAESVMRAAIREDRKWWIYKTMEGIRLPTRRLPNNYLGRFVEFDPSGRIMTMIGPIKEEVTLDGAARFLVEKMRRDTRTN